VGADGVTTRCATRITVASAAAVRMVADLGGAAVDRWWTGGWVRARLAMAHLGSKVRPVSRFYKIVRLLVKPWCGRYD
jgi:hypothetical protein